MDHASHKTCTQCGQSKPLEDFRWQVKAKGQRIAKCRPCDVAYRARRQKERSEQVKEIAARALASRKEKVANGSYRKLERKTCIGCNRTYPIAEFRWQSQALDLRINRCRICDKLKRADYYQENKEVDREIGRRIDQKLRDIVLEAKKDKPCMDCGVVYPSYVMDFDHRDPSTKIAKVSAMVYYGSEPLLFAEIGKCDLVCANCHRIRTFQRKKKT